MSAPSDYLHRLYAGVLGKLIGVYLGRPFEQWPHEDILSKLGHIEYYVNDKVGHPLIVSDDDISGTFTFVRALEDNDFRHDLSAADIGRSWLNYIIQNRTILWWGGMGVSTEHTAYNRLIAGIDAPRSGSIELNGPVVAEQIGAQIFIDGWGLICPGDPRKAAEFARAAGSVSHDGEAIYGAQVVAAMVAAAFVDRDLTRITDTALSLIPRNCLIADLIADLREVRARHDDWRKGHERILEKWSYQLYGGGCHMVPNHAVIHLALLWGDGQFQKSMMVVNNAGYDTDCNAGNVGCILGVRGGLEGLEAGPDWRTPVADRLLVPTADGGSCITDAVRETYRLARYAAALRGETLALPKGGARWHFSLPGSVQGFTPEKSGDLLPSCSVGNIGGELAVDFRRLTPGRVARVATPVFATLEESSRSGYGMEACPTLYPGQTVSAAFHAGTSLSAPVLVRLYARRFKEGDKLHHEYGPSARLTPGAADQLSWRVPETGGQPYQDVGLEITAADPAAPATGTLLVSHVDVRGTPTVTFEMPAVVREKWEAAGKMWFRQWVGAADRFAWGDARRGEVLQLDHNTGTGLGITGTRDWTDYTVATTVEIHLPGKSLLCARVQGLRRYYALALTSVAGRRKLQILKCLHTETVLAERDFEWPLYKAIDLKLTVVGDHIRAVAAGETLEARDTDRPFRSGGIALGATTSRLKVWPVHVSPAT